MTRHQAKECQCHTDKFCMVHQGGCGRHCNLEPDSHCECARLSKRQALIEKKKHRIKL